METMCNTGLLDGGEGDLRNFSLFYLRRFVNGIFLPIVGFYWLAFESNFSHSGDFDYFFLIILNIGYFPLVVWTALGLRFTKLALSIRRF